MKELLMEIIQEAQQGKVNIDGEEWPIKFSTIFYEDNRHFESDSSFATLTIHNEERFLALLEEYIELELQKKRPTSPYQDKDKSTRKALLTYLFANATTEDFVNPEEFVKRRIAFLKDETFQDLEEGIVIQTGESLLNSQILIQKKDASVSMETPYKIEMTFQKEINGKIVKYSLPSIYYAIENGTCYLYGILKPKTKSTSEEEENYQKKMNRLLYKLNEGVEDKAEYPEANITDITHSFLMAASIFMSLLEAKQIKEVKVVTYLPQRYASRDQVAEEISSEERKQELIDRNDRIQKNITDKIIRLFRRLTYHNQNVEIISYPYEVEEYLTLRIHPEKHIINNEILEEVHKEIEGEEEHEFHRNI